MKELQVPELIWETLSNFLSVKERLIAAILPAIDWHNEHPTQNRVAGNVATFL